MSEWIKIQSFSRLHQAEIRQIILDQADINSVIVNEKDSLFLFGEIELMVQDKDQKKALTIIEEFNGLSKVNSFVSQRPMENFASILKEAGLNPFLKRKEDNKYILDNFEVYVPNDELEKVIPFLKGESLGNWHAIEKCTRVSQTKFRTELLDEADIDYLIIKKKNSEYHTEEIDVFVRDENKSKASELLQTLNGWIVVDRYPEIYRTEIREDILKQNGVRSIIREENNEFRLYVEASNEEKAIDVLNSKKEWELVDTFHSILEAEYFAQLLRELDYDAVVVNQYDSSFLLGDTQLFVDKEVIEKAKEIIKEYIESE